MFEEKYEELNNSEKEEFKRLVNMLLGKTFIVNRVYDNRQEAFKYNLDYRFIDRNLELFRDYFSYSGFLVKKDSNYEVIYLENEFSYNRVKLDKSTTVFLYAIRLKFDEERETINLTQDTVVSVSDIVKTLMDVGAYDKKPTDSEIRNSLSKLISFNIIQKIDGPLDSPDTKIIILPSILFAVTNEKILSLSKMIDKLDSSDETEEEEDEVINEDASN